MEKSSSAVDASTPADQSYASILNIVLKIVYAILALCFLFLGLIVTVGGGQWWGVFFFIVTIIFLDFVTSRKGKSRTHFVIKFYSKAKDSSLVADARPLEYQTQVNVQNYPPQAKNLAYKRQNMSYLMISSFFDWLRSIISEIKNKFSKFKIKSNIKNLILKSLEELRNLLNLTISSFFDWLRSIISEIKNKFSKFKIKSNIKNLILKSLEELRNLLKNIILIFSIFLKLLNLSLIFVRSLKLLSLPGFFVRGFLKGYKEAEEKRRLKREQAEEKQRLERERMNSIEEQFIKIDKMDGYIFEKYVKNVYEKSGYSVHHTPLSGDQGADLILSRNGNKIAVQVKRYSSKVTNKAVQEVVAAKAMYECTEGLVVTNNFFTDSAIELALANSIDLVDRDGLEKMIIAIL